MPVVQRLPHTPDWPQRGVNRLRSRGRNRALAQGRGSPGVRLG